MKPWLFNQVYLNFMVKKVTTKFSQTTKNIINRLWNWYWRKCWTLSLQSQKYVWLKVTTAPHNTNLHNTLTTYNTSQTRFLPSDSSVQYCWARQRRGWSCWWHKKSAIRRYVGTGGSIFDSAEGVAFISQNFSQKTNAPYVVQQLQMNELEESRKE